MMYPRVGIMENLNIAGAAAIEQIQRTFKGHETFMHAVTEIGNSAHTFSLLIPLAAAIDMDLANNLIVAATIGEWTSTLLKWLFMEGRPYWWVRESTSYATLGLTPPQLMQTHLTCETGAGSPSGHTMHIAIIGYVFMQWLLPKLDPRSRWNADSGYIRYSLRLIYGLVITMVAFSRMFIAAHFPHQCVLGALIGIPLARLLTSNKTSVARRWRCASSKELLATTGFMTITAVSAYWLQRAFGLNPQWSVSLAFKWCSDPKNIHVSTTNVFSLVRDCGTALGFAVAAPTARSLRRRRVSVLVGLLLALLINVGLSAAQKAVPTANFVTFFVAHYVLFAAMPIILVLSLWTTSQAEEPSPPSNHQSLFRQSNEVMVPSVVRASQKKKPGRASTSSDTPNAHSKID